MAMPLSSTLAPERRKKLVTYGRSARLIAATKSLDEAPSQERLRKQTSATYGTAQRSGTIVGTGSTQGPNRLNVPKSPVPRDVYEFPSDNEPTPRAAPPSKRISRKTEPADEFDVPSSDDENTTLSRRVEKSALKLRKTVPSRQTAPSSKKRSQRQEQVEVPSSDDPLAALPAPTTRGRAKTPQTAHNLASVEQSQRAKPANIKPRVTSRATTPAPPPSITQKKTRATAAVVVKKSAAKHPATEPPGLGVFDIPTSDDDVPAQTPVRPGPRPSSRSQARPRPTASVPHEPPSPAPSADSEASNLSHKRKRRASVSSSTTAKGTGPLEKNRETIAVQRSNKYPRKEDSISPGHNAKTTQQPIVLVASTKEPTINKPKRTRVRTNLGPPRAPIVKVQSSPAKLHNMLAMRSVVKSPPVARVQEEAVVEDETMYEIPREHVTPVRRAKASIPGSVTPRQQALFSNLLGDSSDCTTPMPNIAKLQLSARRPGSAIAALARSSSDLPQSAHIRKSRLIDVLKKAAPSSDEEEGSESDEETEKDMTDIPAVSAPSQVVVNNTFTPQSALDEMDVVSELPTNSQTSQAAVRLHSGSRVTYAKQRSYLEEAASFEEQLLMNLDEDFEVAPSRSQGLESEDEEDSQQIRGIHELRRQGQHHKFTSEAQAAIDDISEPGLKPSQRRSAMMELATRLADRIYVDQLLESSLTAPLLRSLAPIGDDIFDFAAAVAVIFILETRPGFAVVDQIYQSKVLSTLDKLLGSGLSSFDVCRIAKDKKTNMASSARETVAEFRALLLQSSIWPDEKPEKVSPQLVAMKTMELLVPNLRKSGNTEPILDEGAVSKLLDVIHSPSQRLKSGKATAQDGLILDMAISIFESLSVCKDTPTSWSKEIVSRMANIMPAFFEAASASPIRLVIRLCMNLTNNKPEACQIFASPAFVAPLLRSIIQNFKYLASDLDEQRRVEAMEDLILSLGAMINLAEFSDGARASAIQDGDELIGELTRIFLEGSARAEQADSMEESQSSVTIGYLTVLLGNLCLDAAVRSSVRSHLPGGRIDMLVQKVREFVDYNQRVDRLAGQFAGDEGSETVRRFTQRLMRVVEGLERAGA